LKKQDFTEEQLFRGLLDASVDGMLAFDRECRYTAWNSAMERIFGVGRERMLGRVAFEVFPFLVATGEDKYFYEALAGRSAVSEARPYTIPETGRRGFFDGYYAPLRDRLGAVVGGSAIIRDITASHETQDALRVSEERYRAFISNSSEGIWRFELEQPVAVNLPPDEQIELFYRHGYLAECNDAMAQMYGYERADEITGARLGDLLVRADPKNVEYLRAFIAANYRLTDAESVEVDREGRERFFWNNLVGIVKDGRTLRAWGTQRDVTERKRIEEELRATKRRLQLVADHAPVLITYCGADRTYKFVNRPYAERFGLRPAELVGRPFHIVMGREAYDAIERYVDAVLRGERVEFETEVPYQGIGTRHMWAAYEPEFDAAGRVTGFVSAILDITERKRAEVALRESEERFAKAFEASPLASTITSLKTGRLLEVNETFTRLSGHLREEAVGRTTLELGLWAQPADRAAELAMLAQRGQLHNIEYRFRMKDGVERVGLLSAVRIEIGGEPCALTVIKDITEQKRTEAEREHLLAREQELRVKAEEANRLKDEFLATISHELRTPLTAILGWATMLRSNRFDEAALTRALETIERNAKNQKQIIEDLLDVSRIITGKLRLEIRPVELASLIEAAVESLRPAAEAKEVRLQKVLAADLEPIAADPARLQQIIWNLLSNAIKFTPRGGRVQIRLEHVDAHAEISISDTGQGISPEFLPFVFDRFRQADSTTTRKHGGLGLGLAIVRHLVELHGGTVKAESEGAGQGSTFTVTLPPLPVYQTAAAEADKPRVIADSPPAFDCAERLDGLKILAVDDEADTCELLRAALTECGAQVTTARSAQDALVALGRLLPDVLISDIGMPDEDGYELIRRVRRLPAANGGETPAVALTAYAGVEDRLRVLREGYQMHVPKPVELAELIAVVASLVKRPKSA
jgi:PAS domain S-box-containing protein